MSYNFAAERRRNADRRLNPRPGDYWDETLNVVMLVLEVNDEYVTIVEDKIKLDHGYRFDYSKAKVLTRQEFSRKPCYGGTGNLKDECWCRVSEEPADWVLSDWQTWLSIEGNMRPAYILPVNKSSVRDTCR